MMANGQQIASRALTCRGDKYVLGSDPSPANLNPVAEDCSGLVHWSCAVERVSIPAGSWIQAKHCLDNGTEISVDRAKITPGALLFYFSSNSWLRGVRPHEAHVVISLGNAAHQDIEAHNRAKGVNVFDLDGIGWTFCALIPGVSYPSTANPMAEPQGSAPDFTALRRGLAAQYANEVGALPAMSSSAPGSALQIIELQRDLKFILPGAGVTQSGRYDDWTVWTVQEFQNFLNGVKPGSVADTADLPPGSFTPETKWFVGESLHNIAIGAA